MANHPNRSRTYWYRCPRGFANEYVVGIATNRAAAQQYEAEGWDRIGRDRALSDLVYRGDYATQAYVACEIDGCRELNRTRFEIARAIRTGSKI